MSYDAIVAGAGISGAATACYLRKSGARTLLLERGEPASGGTGKSAAIIRQSYSTPPTDHYPRRTKVIMHALPAASKLPTMPHPCQGVPANPWCRASNASRHKRRHHRHPVESHPANPKHKGRGFTG